MKNQKFIPILFRGHMVRAILGDQKTETRRIVKPQPDDEGLWNHTDFPRSLEDELTGWNGTVDETGESKEFKCPFGQPGDVLWVRETWAKTVNINDQSLWPGRNFVVDDPDDLSKVFIYRADGEWEWLDDDGFSTERSSWKPGIHMPKAACRLFLEVKSVSLERLREITDAGAVAEGVETLGLYPGYTVSSRGKFEGLWGSINGLQSWDENPWVWVIKFKRIERPENFI